MWVKHWNWQIRYVIHLICYIPLKHGFLLYELLRNLNLFAFWNQNVIRSVHFTHTNVSYFTFSSYYHYAHLHYYVLHLPSCYLWYQITIRSLPLNHNHFQILPCILFKLFQYQLEINYTCLHLAPLQQYLPSWCSHAVASVRHDCSPLSLRNDTPSS